MLLLHWNRLIFLFLLCQHAKGFSLPGAGTRWTLHSIQPVPIWSRLSIGYNNFERFVLFHTPSDDEDTTGNTETDPENSIDFGLVAADMLAVCIACQLLGLLDVLNDASFWQNGGWFQPMPTSPSTLPTLVQRIALNGVIYLGLSSVLGNLKSGVVVESKSALPSLFGWAPSFVAGRLLLGIVLDPTYDHGPISGTVIESLRECYFVVIAIASARYIYTLLYK